MIVSNPLPTATGGAAGARSAHRSRFAQAFLAAAIALAAVIGAPGTALGATSVSVTFRTIPTAAIGSEVFVTGTIRPAGGIVPTGLRVLLYVNGTYISSSHADAKGNLSFRIPSTATAKAGPLALRAQFDGTHDLSPARATGTLKVRPATVRITTVPAVKGIPISLGTATAITGADGTATLLASKTGPTLLAAHIEQLTDPAIRVSFTRWGDSVYDEARTITIRGDAQLVIGLRTAYRAAVQFVDENNTAIDPTEITRARFTSSTGQELVLTSFTDRAWWEAGSAVIRTGGLQASATLWRLAEVTMAGTNVVNQGQQAFTPTIDGSWTINLLLFDLTVRTNDALTGGAVGGTAELVYPDNSSKVIPLRSDGSAEFAGLPRGAYTVRLKIDGIAPPTPIALSRTQEATIRVISFLDLAAGGILVLVALGVLLWIGRRRHVGWLQTATAGRVGSFGASGPTGPRPADGPCPSPDQSSPRRPRTLPGSAAGPVHRHSDLLATWSRPRPGRSGGRSSPQAAPSSSRTMQGRNAPVREATPSWPTPSIRPTDPAASGSPAQPPVTTRPASPRPPNVPTAGSTWFETPPDDEGPTHDCPRCGRAVADSARFCRSCGYQQYLIGRSTRQSRRSNDEPRRPPSRTPSRGWRSRRDRDRDRDRDRADRRRCVAFGRARNGRVARTIRADRRRERGAEWDTAHRQPARRPGCRRPQSRSAARPLVFAYYYIWYTTRAGDGRSPTSRSSAPTTAEIGPSWPSTSNGPGCRDRRPDRQLEARDAPRRGPPHRRRRGHQGRLKLIMLYQGLDFDRLPLDDATVASDMQWFLDNYATAPPFHVFGERPVVVWSGTWGYKDGQIRTVRAAIDAPNRALLLGSERSADAYAARASLFDGDAYYWSSPDPLSTPRYEMRLADLAAAVRADGGRWIAPAAPP